MQGGSRSMVKARKLERARHRADGSTWTTRQAGEPVSLAPPPIPIVTRERLLAESVGCILAEAGLDVLPVAPDAANVPATRERPPEVVLVDVDILGVAGDELLAELHARWPAARVIALGTATCADGIQGQAFTTVLSPDAGPRQLVDTVRRALRAVPRPLHRRNLALSRPEHLTAREQDVLLLLAEGRNSKQIAHTLSISEHTVRTHAQHVLEKLHVRSRVEAVRWAFEHWPFPDPLGGRSL